MAFSLDRGWPARPVLEHDQPWRRVPALSPGGVTAVEEGAQFAYDREHGLGGSLSRSAQDLRGKGRGRARARYRDPVRGMFWTARPKRRRYDDHDRRTGVAA